MKQRVWVEMNEKQRKTKEIKKRQMELVGEVLCWKEGIGEGEKGRKVKKGRIRRGECWRLRNTQMKSNESRKNEGVSKK